MNSSTYFASGSPDIGTILIMAVCVILVLPAFYAVHRALNYGYFLHARRYCDKHKIKMERWRFGPGFGEDGIKTEFTVFEIGYIDPQGERKIIRLKIWIFGIRKVLAEDEFPKLHPRFFYQHATADESQAS